MRYVLSQATQCNSALEVTRTGFNEVVLATSSFYAVDRNAEQKGPNLIVKPYPVINSTQVAL